MSYKILVTDKISPKGLSILQKIDSFSIDEKTNLSPEELKKTISIYDAILIRSGTTLTKDILEHAHQLKIIGRAGVGVDNVDVDYASLKGVIVMNAPSGNTLSTAELSASMLLSLARNIPQSNASMKAKLWERKKFLGTELFGKTLGIIGLGRIGRELCKRMKSFGMMIVAYDPYAHAELASSMEIEIVDDIAELFEKSDFISIHTPLTDQTKYLINKESLSKMKDGVCIVNCARGGLVDEKALVDAIHSGKVAGAAFDSYEKEPPEADHPFYTMDSVIMTPHLGASTREAQENVAIDVCNQLVDALQKNKIVNAVNYVQVSPETFKLLSPFFSLSEHLGNILASLNKGRYKQIDVSYFGDLSEHNTELITISAIKGLLKPILEPEINNVNARYVAKSRGIAISVTKNAQSLDFSSLIRVTLSLEDGSQMSVDGTLFGKNEGRIVGIDGYRVDLQPQGFVLVCHNIDQKGFVGRIGTILGEHQINIANMTLGRQLKGADALTVFNVDDIISDDILEKIRSLDDILRADFVRFDV